MLKRSLSVFVVLLLAPFILLTTGVAQAQQLTINDVSQAEGQAGTTTFTFIVSLDSPAVTTVTFDIQTADSTALGGEDYTTQALTGQSIAIGDTSYTFSVLVQGDVTPEPTETFFVNVTNVVGATVSDAQGRGTIITDDSVTPIHDIQGPGASSPLVGAVVTTQGIVTGVTSGGFFLQQDDAGVDADPATSEAIFVDTTSSPVVVEPMQSILVSGTVIEFVSSGDPQDPPATRLVGATILTASAPDQPLPAPVVLTTTFPDPAGPFDQLERLEHMRVTVPSLTVSGPSGGVIDEINATATNDGRFYGVVTGVARPFREAGIQAPDTPPTGSIPPIPRFDGNPERLRVESAALGGMPLLVSSRDQVGPLTGPLTYASRAYTLLLDEAMTPTITPGPPPDALSMPAGNAATVASINLRRLFDQFDDPTTAEPMVTAAAFHHRLGKISRAIRDHLHAPDIIGVQDVESLYVLQRLGTRILEDGGPAYGAYFGRGDDPLGLGVGLLVKRDPVSGGLPRVSVTNARMIGSVLTFIDPTTGVEAPLFDRPPYFLEGTVNRGAGARFPIAVMITDVANAIGIDDEAPNGLATTGQRVRAQRLEQAKVLAEYLQGWQDSHPDVPLAVIGSFHALDVNDGYVDVMGLLTGQPAPDAETVVPGDGIDVMHPDLVRLVDAQPAARYSEVIAGNASATDHVLVSAALVAGTLTRHIERARINADHPETLSGDGTTALRFSDHDPVMAYFVSDALDLTDLTITNVAPATILPGQALTYSITVTNAGPDTAASVSWSDTLPAGTTFLSLSSQAGWTCTTPAVGAGGTITCSISSFAMGSVTFSLGVGVTASVAPGTTLSATATVGSVTADADQANNTATATTTVDGAPTITAITDQTLAAGESTPALPFTIGDAVTPAASLTLSATSSNHALVPNANIVIAGTGAARTVTITPLPGQSGATTITLTVSDGADHGSTSFLVTVAPRQLTYYLAEGATGSFFDDDLLIANPNEAEAPVTVTFHPEHAARVTETRTIPARSGLTLRVDSLPGMEATAASTTVTSESGLPLAVERTQFWGTGSYGGATETASTGPATRWYFAEGAQGYFDTFILVANPQPSAADLTVTFLREGESAVTTTLRVPEFSRKTIPVSSLPDLDGRAFSIIVDATQPIVAERAMYFGSTAAQPWRGGSAAAGVTAPSDTWFFAEGATGPFFDTFILLMNPDDSDAQVTMQYLLDTGEAIDVPKVVPGRGRLTVGIDSESDPRLRHATMATRVAADRPIVAERSIYWPTAEGVKPWGESHTNAGAAVAGARWALAEGRTGGPLNFHTYVLLANPGAQPATVTVQFLPASGSAVMRTYTVSAQSRFTIDVTAEAPSIQEGSFVTVIETNASTPIVVERSMYWDGAGLTWAGGTNASGTRLP